ncbi:FxSxx-COOH system tetratricopeptide repeat protein [Actinomadura sp. ATCC 31491]|uniref:FxSxx-COOH system tetratricopeptide repeat protein n=1 Tax=Actinomadura luzonensis TaxID=2805427 RepID=A0ABT0G6C8_9ACTN|nr:FxSxx-COOH system tetratricopeptide repeat protein [Actinomadura luzonensis]MCK2219658.1 FxSxx-COOH system tetratricopeptide repeat protein [Actinomadura luzonensis]
MPSKGAQIWERVPKRNLNFTGRKELLAALRKSINTVTAVVAQPQALQGLGGVGKTQLAIEYAWQYRAHYDLVLWVSADQPLLVPSALAELAPKLGLPTATGVGVEQTTQAVLRTLESGSPYRSWLVIFDNAEEPEFIKDFIPRGPGHVIITSRNSRWSDHEPTIQVDVFRREESVAFLRRRLSDTIGEREADRVADKLGDLPIALEQAAALLARTLMPVEDYLDLLEEQTSRLLDLEKAPTYPRSMTAAWRLSVSQLEERVPAAVEVLRCCAFFGPEPIPRDVFRRGNRAVGPRLTPILSNPIELTNALSNLERLALVKVEPSTRTLQVHRLNQALLRDETPEKDRVELRHEVHLLLSGTAPAEPDDTANWPRYEELAAHLEPSGLIDCTVPSVRRFALDLVRYLYVRGSYRQAESLLHEYITKWTEVSGAHHKDVLAARVHLANVYLGLAAYDRAEELAADTYRLMSESLGAEHTETLWAMTGYAGALRGRGNFIKARELDESAATIYERVRGDTDPFTLRARHNLALDYTLTSDYHEASDMLQDIYLKQSSMEGIGRRLLLLTWTNLSRAVRLDGQFEVATDLAEEAHSYGAINLGDDHPSTLLAARDLAICLRRMGRLPEALQLMRDTHIRSRRLYGDAHANTMAAALGLSNVLRAVDEREEALELVERALRHYPEVFGDDHPFTHAAKMNLALLTRLNGDPEAARDLDEKALAGLAGRVGRDHDYTVSCAINLQNDLAALGRHDDARALGQDNLERIQARFSADHYLSLICAANLCLDLQATGADEEARRLRAETTLRFESVMSREHPDALGLLAGERLNCDFDPPAI